MTEDERLADLAAKTAALQADAPRCSCYCECRYVLTNIVSRDFATCFSCRAKVHAGRKEDPS